MTLQAARPASDRAGSETLVNWLTGFRLTLRAPAIPSEQAFPSEAGYDGPVVH
jgi:hypothetical protein